MTTGWQEHVGGSATASPGAQHWAHHDLVVLSDGTLVAPTPDGDLVLVDSSTDSVVGRIEVDANEIHGLALVETDGRESIWVADCGFTMVRDDDGNYVPGSRGGSRGPRAVHVDLDGNELASIGVPREHPAYADAMFLPTAVAVDETRHGGDGSVWVADGYGAGLVHRFDADGNWVRSLDGTTGAGRFDCPHSIFIDRRRAEPRLLVADRGNARVQVHALDGSYVETFGEGALTSPSAFAVTGDRLVIAELEARVVVLDIDDQLTDVLGADADAPQRPGWPNALDDDRRLVRPPLRHGRFNSPHGLATDRDGRLFVTEWLIGGRLVSLDSRS